MINNPNKDKDLDKLRQIDYDNEGYYDVQTCELLKFIAKQLIDIKYDIREIKNKQHGI